MSAKIKELLEAQGLTQDVNREGMRVAITGYQQEMQKRGEPGFPAGYIEGYLDEMDIRYDEIMKQVERIVWEFTTDEEADAMIAFFAKWPGLAAKQKKIAQAVMSVTMSVGADAGELVMKRLDRGYR